MAQVYWTSMAQWNTFVSSKVTWVHLMICSNISNKSKNYCAISSNSEGSQLPLQVHRIQYYTRSQYHRRSTISKQRGTTNNHSNKRIQILRTMKKRCIQRHHHQLQLRGHLALRIEVSLEQFSIKTIISISIHIHNPPHLLRKHLLDIWMRILKNLWNRRWRKWRF